MRWRRARRDGDAGRGGVDAGHADPVRRVRALADPAPAADAQAPEYDTIDAATRAPVIIAGFGRVGQIVGRVLRMHGIAFTALERDPGQVDVVRRFGSKVYYGDPTRADVLRAAGAETAKLLVVVLDDMEAVLRTVDVAKRTFPGLARSWRGRATGGTRILLMDRGVDGLVRDTFHSSLELAENGADRAWGSTGRGGALRWRCSAIMTRSTLVASHAIYRDETQVIQTTQDAAAELESLFEADRERE